MKNKIFAIVFMLSLLVSGSLIVVENGTESENREILESTGSEPEFTQLADPPWSSFGRDRKNTGRSPYNTSHVDGTEKWSFTTEGRFCWPRAPAVAETAAIGDDGTIYFGTGDMSFEYGYFYALNPDGTEKWSFETVGYACSSPAIGEDGTIYFGSTEGIFYALDPDGTEKWSFDTGSIVRSSPAIDENGMIYVGTRHWNLYALNSNGTEKWRFTAGGSIRSSPAICDEGTIYVGSQDNHLYAISPDGTEKWSFETGADVISSPTIHEDGTIYVGSWDNNLYALNPDGTEIWSFETDEPVFSSPSIGLDGTVYVGSEDGKLYAINPNGTIEWSFQTGAGVRVSPAIAADGFIYIGSHDGNLYAINPDGTMKWNFELQNIHLWTFSPAIGEDGTIYFGSYGNVFYAVGVEYFFTIEEPVGEGSILVNGEEVTEWPYEGVYGHNEEVEIEAVPDDGWSVVGWAGDHENEEERITVTINENKEITAHFEEETDGENDTPGFTFLIITVGMIVSLFISIIRKNDDLRIKKKDRV